jgi:hypothetical protein
MGWIWEAGRLTNGLPRRTVRQRWLCLAAVTGALSGGGLDVVVARSADRRRRWPGAPEIAKCGGRRCLGARMNDRQLRLGLRRGQGWTTEVALGTPARTIEELRSGTTLGRGSTLCVREVALGILLFVGVQFLAYPFNEGLRSSYITFHSKYYKLL